MTGSIKVLVVPLELKLIKVLRKYPREKNTQAICRGSGDAAGCFSAYFSNNKAGYKYQKFALHICNS